MKYPIYPKHFPSQTHSPSTPPTTDSYHSPSYYNQSPNNTNSLGSWWFHRCDRRVFPWVEQPEFWKFHWVIYHRCRVLKRQILQESWWIILFRIMMFWAWVKWLPLIDLFYNSRICYRIQFEFHIWWGIWAFRQQDFQDLFFLIRTRAYSFTI